MNLRTEWHELENRAENWAHAHRSGIRKILSAAFIAGLHELEASPEGDQLAALYKAIKGLEGDRKDQAVSELESVGKAVAEAMVKDLMERLTG